MLKKLESKIALITGSSRGIGAAVPQTANTALNRHESVDAAAALVAFGGRSGNVLHHRLESDRRRWYERVTKRRLCIENNG